VKLIKYLGLSVRGLRKIGFLGLPILFIIVLGSQAVYAQEAISSSAPEASVISDEEKKIEPKVLKTTSDDEYIRPLYFEATDKLLPTMKFEYDLTGEDGNVLRVGDVVIDDRSLVFAMMPVSKLHPNMTSSLGAEEASKTALVMRWPEALQQTGTLEVIGHTGSVLWKENITEKKRNLWKAKLEIWKKVLEKKGVKTALLPETSVFFTQYGILDVAAQGLKPFGESFRFCLARIQGRSQSRLCSQRYVIRGNGKELSMSKLKTVIPPRVLLQSQSAALKQSVPVARDMPTAFFAELASGESYEFIAIPNKLNLMDLTELDRPGEFRIVAWGTRPTMPSKVLNPEMYSPLTRAIGFQATVGDMRKFWEVVIGNEDPTLYLPGQGGGIFSQRFELSEIPRSATRPYLDIQTPPGTYEDGVKLYGKKIPEAKITSLENSIEVDEKDPNYFLWRFKAVNRGEINRSYLSMEYQGKEYKYFYELYKGFPREVSLRLSGLLQPSGESVFLGEVAYNQWFENFMGVMGRRLGRQRWGLSTKYFKTLTKLTVNSSTGKKADMAVVNVDLKYRFVPGLWCREETLGLMLDYQSFAFDQMSVPMLGAGAFWARSMPKVFDDIFNLLPMMKYPKWVDMEFIYYPVSLASQVTLQTNFALNFHGKVLWTKSWFGEAGFGLKRYAIVDSHLQQKAALNTFYGTIGLGLSF
jgi:hypothetical protein